MKNITTYSLFVLLLTLCFSCVKEADLITESGPEVIPQEGETRIITGMVKDTAGIILPNASVKVILDDLELITEADENGEWNLMVPISKTEGYVVANKIEYSKAIKRFNEVEDNRVEDIYLTKEQSNNELDLGFDLGNIKTLIGKVIDENANPIADVKLILFSQLDNSQMEYVFNGIEFTGEDGTFEIIYEDNEFISTTLNTLFLNQCGDSYSFSIQGLEPIEDLGDLELSYDSHSIFQTNLESDGSSCYDNVSTLAFYWKFNSGSLPVSYDQPLGNVSLEYCPGENGTFYVGCESEDNTHFNGLFFPHTEIQAAYMLDICTPNPGNFLELNINGNVTLYEDNLLFIAPRTVISQAPDTQLFFTVLNWITASPVGGGQPRYQIGEIKSLNLSGTKEISFNNIEDDRPFNHVNIVQDDDLFYAGVAQANLLAEDGSEVDLTIRFRVGK